MYFDIATMDIDPRIITGLEQARRDFVPLFNGKEAVQKHIARTIPWRILCRRGARSTPICFYPLTLSEVAYEKYKRAKDSKLFDIFDVVTPTHGNVNQRGSWIMGRVSCTNWWTIIAQLDVF